MYKALLHKRRLPLPLDYPTSNSSKLLMGTLQLDVFTAMSYGISHYFALSRIGDVGAQPGEIIVSTLANPFTMVQVIL